MMMMMMMMMINTFSPIGKAVLQGSCIARCA